MAKPKFINFDDLKPGDVIQTRNGDWVYLFRSYRSRKYAHWGAYYRDALRMLKGDSRMRTRFYGLPYMHNPTYVGKMKPAEVEKLMKIYKEMNEHNDELRKENFDKIDFKSEPTWGYVVTLENGDEVRPGDTVVVSFKNGASRCRVGNKNKQLYDGNTGRVYVWPYRFGQPDPYRKKAMSVMPRYILRKVTDENEHRS